MDPQGLSSNGNLSATSKESREGEGMQGVPDPPRMPGLLSFLPLPSPLPGLQGIQPDTQPLRPWEGQGRALPQASPPPCQLPGLFKRRWHPADRESACGFTGPIRKVGGEQSLGATGHPVLGAPEGMPERSTNGETLPSGSRAPAELRAGQNQQQSLPLDWKLHGVGPQGRHHCGLAGGIRFARGSSLGESPDAQPGPGAVRRGHTWPTDRAAPQDTGQRAAAGLALSAAVRHLPLLPPRAWGGHAGLQGTTVHTGTGLPRPEHRGGGVRPRRRGKLGPSVVLQAQLGSLDGRHIVGFLHCTHLQALAGEPCGWVLRTGPASPWRLLIPTFACPPPPPPALCSLPQAWEFLRGACRAHRSGTGEPGAD